MASKNSKIDSLKDNNEPISLKEAHAISSSSNDGSDITSFVKKTLKALKRPSRETLEPNLKRRKASSIPAYKDDRAWASSSLTLDSCTTSLFDPSAESVQLSVDSDWSDSEFLDDESLDEDETDSTNKTLPFKIEWTHVTEDYEPYPLSFTASPGLDFNLALNPSPLEVFQTLFDSELLNYITLEANRYAHEIGVQTTKHGICTDLSTNELQTFIGITLYMGLVRMDTIKGYWSTDKRFGTTAIAPHMTYNRFSEIRNSLQFISSLAFASSDLKTVKSARSLLTILREKFSIFMPKPELFASESLLVGPTKQTLVQSKGNYRFIKLYTLQEAQSGYFLNFQLDSGRDYSPEIFFLSNIEGVPKTERLLCKLVEPFEGVGHILYSDVSCCSPLLSLILRSKAKMDSVFLFDSYQIRRIPSQISKADLNPDEPFELVGSALGAAVLVQRWQHKHRLPVISSSIHSNKMITYKRPISSQPQKSPESMIRYKNINSYISKVDHTIGPYFLSKGNLTKRTQIRFFNRILNMAVHNAYVIYAKLSSKTKITNERHFRKALVNEILDNPN